MDLFAKHKDETLKELEARMQLRSYQPGESLYVRGAPGDELFWVRRGTVRIVAPLGAGRVKHIATFGRGDFFGGLAFLDSQPRSNDAIAETQTEVYVLSRDQFNQIAEQHKKLAFNLVTAMARTLALRLRHSDTELAMMQEY
jgi:SulP family sulfate permease